MKGIDQFMGHLMTFDGKGEGAEVIDEDIMLEITDVTNDGTIELAFTDRNERCYVSFQLSEVIQRCLELHGRKQ